MSAIQVMTDAQTAETPSLPRGPIEPCGPIGVWWYTWENRRGDAWSREIRWAWCRREGEVFLTSEAKSNYKSREAAVLGATDALASPNQRPGKKTLARHRAGGR